jgi:hypothetical protein
MPGCNVVYSTEYQRALRHLLEDDPGAAVPCSRYGRTTEECAPIAAAVAVIVAMETEGDTIDCAEHVMGLVVNDHEDPERMLRDYGAECGFPPAGFLGGL